MADNYLQFSTELNVGSAENAQAALKVYEEFPFKDEDGEEWAPYFQCKVHGDRLWLRDDDDGHGDPDQVVAFVVKLAQQFNLKGKWGFQWAYTCSRPILDEFGGGAAAIDLATGHVEVLYTGDWLHERVREGGTV
jgi:hypothetical protein